MHRKRFESAVTISDISRRHMNYMRQALRINGNVALNSRYFLSRIITFVLRRICVFNALSVNNTKASFLSPTIVSSDLANGFFLRLAPKYFLSLSLDAYSIS